jgi:prophage maintenance system killer protein
LFFEENGIKITFSDQDFEEFVVTVAQGQKNKEEIAYFLRYGKELSKQTTEVC